MSDVQRASEMELSSDRQQSGNSTGNRHVRWKRWTIAGTLFLMFCMAGFFTGFRYGLTEAVDRQVELRLAERQQVVYAISYRIPVLPAVDRAPSQTNTRLQSPSENNTNPNQGQASDRIVAAKPPIAESDDNMADLVAGVRQAVGRNQWSESGGPCSLGLMAAPAGGNYSGTIVVSAPSDVHQQVAAFLEGWETACSSR